MKNNQLVLSEKSAIGWNWKKSILMKILSKLTHGSFSVYEKGELIGIFGNPSDNLKADINILDDQFYGKLLFGGSIGVGEAYIEHYWNTSDLTKVIQIFARNIEILDQIEDKFRWLSMPLNKINHWARKNSIAQAKKNISSHYDLSNDLYKSFLDETMLYSSAIYKSKDDTLEQAQQYKMKLICEKLDLKPSDKVLEIGTGWGALAIYMAKNYGCHVTTTTISEDQHQYTSNQINKYNLSKKVTLLKKDYRELDGKYDKLVSIEMIEAVGKNYMDGFFKKCNQLLKADGVMLLQSITISEKRLKLYQDNVDFIQKYIFPGGFLPSLQMLQNKVVKNTDLHVRDVHDIGLDYAQTLHDWRVRFEDNYNQIKPLGFDDKFYRMWKFYLEYCEGGFLERTISTVQVLMTAKEHKSEIQFRK